MQRRLALGQRLLRLLSLGDVAHDALVRAVGQATDRYLDRKERAVFAPHRALEQSALDLAEVCDALSD